MSKNNRNKKCHAFWEAQPSENRARYEQAKLIASSLRWLEVILMRMHKHPALLGRLFDVLDALAFEWLASPAEVRERPRHWVNFNHYHRSLWKILQSEVNGREPRPPYG